MKRAIYAVVAAMCAFLAFYIIAAMVAGKTYAAEAPRALSAEYIPPTPSPTPVPTPAPTPSPTPKPVEPEENEQYSRATIWMLDAEIDPCWADQEGDNFSEILSRLLFQYDMEPEAACGIIANMWFESNFIPDIMSTNGYYGLCQWSRYRQGKLWDYCASNDLDSSTVEGQIAYMMNELDGYDVDFSGSAYECADSFCRVFEAPPNVETQARLRGNYAGELFERFFA